LKLWRHLAASSSQRNRARNGRGEYRRDVAKVERDAEACRLAAQGWTLDAIAKKLGYAQRGNVSHAIDNMLLQIARTQGAEELRAKQLAEMAELRRKMWEIVNDPPPAIDRQGRIVVDGATGERVPDVQAVIQAGAVIIRAGEREAKLTGADAARRSEVHTIDVITTEMHRVRAEIAARELGERQRGQLVAGEVDADPEPRAAAVAR
jgi:hypothetical protein